MSGIPIIGQVPSKGDKISRVDAMNKSVQAHLNGIAHWFDEPMITLVVRTEKGGDLIITNDDAASAIEALQRHEQKAN